MKNKQESLRFVAILINAEFKSEAGTVKLKIQNGVAVDPQSELDDRAHVYRDPLGNIYNASLSLTDLQLGKNSYYKLQVLESNSESYKR